MPVLLKSLTDNMALPTLKFTVSDSSENDVDLMDATYGGVVKYQPIPPETGATSVSETIVVDFRPGGSDAPRTKMNMVNRMFVLARARKNSGKGPRVFLYCETSNLNTPFRAEVYDGRVSHSEDVFGSEVAQNWYTVTIAVTRSPWWESSAETQLALTNGNATNNTSGLTVQNAETGSLDNWFNIPTAQLPSNTSGDVEAPIRLEITNTTPVITSALNTTKLYVGMAKSNNFASNRIPVFEGESGSAGATVSTASQAGTQSSNGNYMRCQWTNTNIVSLLTWTLSAADLQRMRGLRFTPFLRLGNALATSDYDFGWQIIDSGLIPLSPIKWARGTTSDYCIQLNGNEIPPYLSDAATLNSLSLALKCRRLTGGTNTVDVDAVYLLPCDPVHGGMRAYSTRTGGLPLNDKLVEDGVTQQTYEDNSANGGGVLGGWRTDGDWLTIRPNCNNQFYTIQVDSGGVPDARRTLSVKAYYRPRRLTL